MPKFVTLNERLAQRQPTAVAVADTPPFKVVDGVFYYWDQDGGEWVSIVDEASTSINNIYQINNQTTTGKTDIEREMYFAGLGRRLL